MRTMKRLPMLRCFALLVVVVLLIVGCSGQYDTGEQPVDTLGSGPAQDFMQPVSPRDLKIVTGQRLYVPAYSEIYSGDETATFDLAVTLSVRNTDPDTPIAIGSIQYYDTAGSLVKEYIEMPLKLPPMATTEAVISRLDKQGGTGANFIVEWGAESKVYEPIVEALMTSTAAQQGIAFISPARVLEEKE